MMGVSIQQPETRSYNTSRIETRTVHTLAVLSLISFLLTATETNGQVQTHLDDIDASAEQLEAEAESIDALIASLRHVNLDINNLSEGVLKNIPGLESADIVAMVAHIRVHGQMTSVTQLDEVIGLSPSARHLLGLLLDASENENRRSNSSEVWMTVRTTVQRSWGTEVSSTPIMGSPYRRTLRLRGQFGRLGAALTGQNEPYEAFRWKPASHWLGFDHVVAFLQYADRAGRFKVTAGDFTIDTGQGLVHARPFGTRLSASAPWRTLRSWSGVSGYAGSTSQRTFRGIAVAFSPISGISASAYLSRKSVDARPIAETWILPTRQDMTHEPGFVTTDTTAINTLVQSDLHITPEQLARRHNSIQRSEGWRIEWFGRSHRIGFQVARTRFDRTIRLRQGSVARNVFGDSSLFWSVSHRSWSSRGEMTLSSAPSMLLGLSFRPSPSFRFSIQLRSFGRSGSTVFGKPYGYKASLKAQVGMLMATGIRLGKRVATALSFDYFRGVGSMDTHFLPVDKSDTRASTKVTFTNRVTLDLAFRNKVERSVTSERFESGVVWARSKIQRYATFACLLHVQINDRMMTRFRMDLNQGGVYGADLKGYHISQTVDLQLLPALSVTIQESLFEAPGTLNRFYIYEPGLSGSISVPLLQDSGSRSSILIRARPLDGLVAEMRYSASATSARIDHAQKEKPLLESRIIRAVGIQVTYQF